MNRFLVYAHYTLENELFYIGEGTMKRAYSKHSRNRYWNNKVSKSGGFIVKIVYDNLTKEQAEIKETRLIRNCLKRDIKLTNFCIGPAFQNHWLVNTPKEVHPMYGKKRPDQSIRISEWNKQHTGENSPTYGKQRPDLIERNKNGNFKRKATPVKCIETGEIFNSVKDANNKYPSKHYSRNIKNNWAICGLHFEYIK